MRIFIAGLACVGKSTIGVRLADILQFRFCDLDIAAELHFQIPIKQLRAAHETKYSFLKTLTQVIPTEDRLVVALPPDGLMNPLVRHLNGLKVLLVDTPENILKRMTWFDMNSQPIPNPITKHTENIYLQKMKSDLKSLSHSFKRADITVDITDLDITKSTLKVYEILHIRLSY